MRQKGKVTVRLTEEVNCCDRAGGAKKGERQSRLGVGGWLRKVEETGRKKTGAGAPWAGPPSCSSQPGFNHAAGIMQSD